MPSDNSEPQSTISPQPPKRTRLKGPERSRITRKVLSLAAQDLPQNTIAQVLGQPKSTVQTIIKRYSKVFKELPGVDDFRRVKADILDAAQLSVLKSGLTDAKLAKSGLLSSMKAFEVLHKAGRLERGESTENVSQQIFGRIAVEPPQVSTSLVEKNCSLNETPSKVRTLEKLIDYIPASSPVDVSTPRTNEKINLNNTTDDSEAMPGGDHPPTTPGTAPATGTKPLRGT